MKMPSTLLRVTTKMATLAKKMVARKNGILASLIVISGLLITVIVVFKPTPDKKDVVEKIWPVTAMPALPAHHSPQLSLYGRVESPRQSSLTAAVTAYVDEVHVLEGASVGAGELLIQLDQIDARLLVVRRKADLTEAKANYETLKLQVADNQRILEHENDLYELALKKSKRHTQLRQQKSISEGTLNTVLGETSRQAISLNRQEGRVKDADNQLARASANIARSEAALTEAHVNFDRTRITAPFNGRVTSVTVAPGEMVRPGMVMVEMYDDAAMEIRSQIPTNNLQTIKKALAGGIDLSATVLLDQRKIDATLTRLSGEVSRGKSSVDGLFSLESETSLELGRAVNIVLSLPEVPDALLVPVQSMYGHDRLFIVAGERLKGITVERVGELRDSDGNLSILVRSAEIGAGIPIVTSQLSNAITGLRVSHDESTSSVADSATVPTPKSS